MKIKLKFLLELFDDDGNLLYTNEDIRIEGRPPIEGTCWPPIPGKYEWCCNIPVVTEEDKAPIVDVSVKAASARLFTMKEDQVLEKWFFREIKLKGFSDNGYLFCGDQEFLMLRLIWECDPTIWESHWDLYESSGCC
jgi:hypothetical protein